MRRSLRSGDFIEDFLENVLEEKSFFWVSEKGKALDLIHVLAHEIAHSAGIKDEDEANKFAAISTFSVHVASKFSKGKIRLK